MTFVSNNGGVRCTECDGWWQGGPPEGHECGLRPRRPEFSTDSPEVAMVLFEKGLPD